MSLNADLAEKEDWTIDDITQRTDTLANQVVDLFAYGGEVIN